MVTTTQKPSLYDVLGIAQTAPPEAVRKAYKRLVLETHPDKLPLDATEEDKAAAEERFREVYQAFEILSDTAKRRVYDNGLNYLRSRARASEVQARLAREREEWDRQSKQRQEERLAAMRAQLRARQERERQKREELKAAYVLPSAYEQRKLALEEELRRARVRQQEATARAEERLRAAMAGLQQAAGVARAASVRSRRLVRAPSVVSQRSSTATATLASAQRMLQAEVLLRAVRELNPELEARRQAALKRKAERMSMYDSVSIASTELV